MMLRKMAHPRRPPVRTIAPITTASYGPGQYSNRNCYPRGKSLIFFRTPPLKPQKIANKITKSKKITYKKHQKSQITEKLLKITRKNH